jgi:hypothetical protein
MRPSSALPFRVLLSHLAQITYGPTRDAITRLATTRENQNDEEGRILCETGAVACSSLRCFGLRGKG